MIFAIIVLLVALWLIGYVSITGISIPNFVLITINNHPVTLWEILIVAVIAWGISILPRPFQAIGSILLILWILSVLGILAITGLSNIIILVIIIGLVASFFLKDDRR
jgi:hypothetical protein